MIGLHEYLNAYKVMRFIDRADLDAVGVTLDDAQWARFRDAPTEWLIGADDQTATQVWHAVYKKARCVQS